MMGLPAVAPETARRGTCVTTFDTDLPEIARVDSLIDNRAPSSRSSTQAGAGRSDTDAHVGISVVGRSLVDRLDSGEPYAIVFAGQGAEWFEPLTELTRDFALESELAAVVDAAKRQLSPATAEMLRVDAEFNPLRWIDAAAMSAENDEPADIPSATELAAPALSVPGIVLTQLAGVIALRRQGVDVTANPPVAVCGHSQGVFAASALTGRSDHATILARAMLAGVAIQVTARRRGLNGNTAGGHTMLSIDGIDDEHLARLELGRAVARLRNGRRTVVLSGPADDLEHVAGQIERMAADERDLRDRKVRGGAPFAPVIEGLNAAVAFHHPELDEAADLAGQWAEVCDLDGPATAALVREGLVDPVDWPARSEERRVG